MHGDKCTGASAAVRAETQGPLGEEGGGRRREEQGGGGGRRRMYSLRMYNYMYTFKR